ncbi:DUF4873 domain-containing protein [Pseudonocardia ailaonensis]|uniref:DUF4873 domain-containing protein n=1 Tax=Pseudonocardia ailaonensis TaxID=367279 RepID=A0ABN2MZK8_9PSEU
MDDEDYAGPATLTVGARTVEVRVRLIARTEPQDGRVHWFGRTEATTALEAGDVIVTTPVGSAAGRIGDVDLWGRYRLAGVGTPPFPCPEPPSD